MSNVPEGAQRSEDGQYWWDADNQEWKAVEGEGGGGASPSQSEGGETGEASQDEIREVDDSGTEPGKEDKLTEKVKPYFEPKGGDDDLTYAEAAEGVDDSQFTGGGGSGESSETESETGST